MKKTEEQLEQKIQARAVKIKLYAKKNIRDRKKIDGMKPVDGFYFNKDLRHFMEYCIDGFYKFGINPNGEWQQIDNNNVEHDNEKDTLATPEEVTDRLTKFVNGAGYKEGVNVESLIHGSTKTIKSDHLYFSLIEGEYYISLGGMHLWNSNKGWAKIVEEPKYEVMAYPMPPDGDVEVLKYSLVVSVDRNIKPDPNGLAKRIETFLNQK